METAKQELAETQQQCEALLKANTQEQQSAIEQMKSHIAELERKLSEYEVEYNMKADEADQAQKKVKTAECLVQEA